MARIQNTVLDRSIRHLSKKISICIRGLAPLKIAGRLSGPIVLANSIPKSGTHFVESLLEQVPGLRNAGNRTLVAPSVSLSRSAVRQIVDMKKGAFYNAHFPGYDEIINAVQERKIKVIFMVRDPRDIVVSRYKYVTYIDKTHKAHRYFASQRSDSDRLRLSITGAKGVMPSIGEVLEKFRPWLDADNVLLCRFEDLIGESGGGSASVQDDTIQGIIDHLGYGESGIDLGNLKKKAFRRKSSTFRKGKIGGWREEFEKAHCELFDNEVGENLKKFGYE